MLITGHWSVSNPRNGPLYNDGSCSNQPPYHIQFRCIDYLGRDKILALGKITDQSQVNWDQLFSSFRVYKLCDLSTILGYATYHINSDPRDHTADICVASLSMVGATTNNYGPYPYDYSHAWIMAALMARVAYIKNIDVGASFDHSVEPSILQNGPIYNLSTHGERAIQTKDYPGGAGSQALSDKFGYFLYSEDPQSRWDCAALDESETADLSDPDKALARCKASAAWLRDKAHQIKLSLTPKSEFLGLDK